MRRVVDINASKTPSSTVISCRMYGEDQGLSNNIKFIINLDVRGGERVDEKESGAEMSFVPY